MLEYLVRLDALRLRALKTPAHPALVDVARGRRLSYAALDQAAETSAARLRALGVGRGDIVALLAGNRIECVALFFACARVGVALLPLNWRLSPAELAAVLADARPAVLVGEERFRPLIAAAHGIPWLPLEEHDPPASDDALPVPPRSGARVLDPEAPALILYTSGSTGRPKGAILPHRQIFWNAVATNTAWELTGCDVAPVSTPFFHTGGWNVFATPLWHRGGTVVLLDGFDAGTFLEVLAAERCTVAVLVPTQLAMLSEQPAWGRPLPALRFLISGGAPCPATLAADVREAGYPFREGYGLTECGPNCFALSSEEAQLRPGSVGRPVPFLEMRLDAGDGRDAGPGEVGELLLRGPQRFAGYLRDAARTAEAVTADGWLRTGDLACRDVTGAYYVRGRRKEMYISGGENVFPGEVEAALAGCSGVAEAVVVGVPDEYWGEVGRAFVVPRAGTHPTEDEVLTYARERIARYKVPRCIVFLPEIPRLGSGKPDRAALSRLETQVPT